MSGAGLYVTELPIGVLLRRRLTMKLVKQLAFGHGG